MTLVCITNQMDDWRSCTIRDAHTVRCESPETCTGCLPRLAQVGLLCYPCWDRVEHAFADWTAERARLMSSIDRAVQRDTGGRTSGPEGYVPIPGTRLAVDEVESYLRGDWTNARAWVSTEDGARNAIRFASAVGRALRTHELEERERPLRRVRCPECGQLSFTRKPPADAGAPVTIVCENDSCRKVIREGDRAPEELGGEEKLVLIAQIERAPRKEHV
jgi:hypothetical protein